MSQFKTQVKLNVLPLGSYDVLIGMDWVEKHRVVLKCFEKTFTCLDEKRETLIVKGIPRKVYVRQISALQMKNYVHKGSKVFVVYVMNDEHMNKEDECYITLPCCERKLDTFKLSNYFIAYVIACFKNN